MGTVAMMHKQGHWSIRELHYNAINSIGICLSVSLLICLLCAKTVQHFAKTIFSANLLSTSNTWVLAESKQGGSKVIQRM